MLVGRMALVRRLRGILCMGRLSGILGLLRCCILGLRGLCRILRLAGSGRVLRLHRSGCVLGLHRLRHVLRLHGCMCGVAPRRGLVRMTAVMGVCMWLRCLLRGRVVCVRHGLSADLRPGVRRPRRRSWSRETMALSALLIYRCLVRVGCCLVVRLRLRRRRRRYRAEAVAARGHRPARLHRGRRGLHG
jgi:hypothetical protein